MTFSPVLLLHICTGVLGFFSGGIAIALRKGSRRHALAGNVFVISMLTMCVTAVYMALMKSQPSNVLGGTFTFYLVGTAWATARQREEQIGILDWSGLLLGLGAVGGYLTYGVLALESPRGLKAGIPAGMYFFMGFIALLAVSGDIRMIARGGVSGAQRFMRHLRRMCFGWFIAAGSIFLARQHLFPAILRKTGVLFLLSFLPLILMVFWLILVRVTSSYNRKMKPRGEGAVATAI
jgi:uncharacterized membrane protein